jgi:hypothetical protein
MPIQRNVQQQNADAKAEIQRVAETYKCGTTSFAWFRTVLQSKGLDEKSGALVKLSETPEQEGSLMSGIWLTQSREFWEFAIMLSRAEREVIEIEEFRNVTKSIPVTDSAPGVGKSFGYLACQVLENASNR